MGGGYGAISEPKSPHSPKSIGVKGHGHSIGFLIGIELHLPIGPKLQGCRMSSFFDDVLWWMTLAPCRPHCLIGSTIPSGLVLFSQQDNKLIGRAWPKCV